MRGRWQLAVGTVLVSLSLGIGAIVTWAGAPVLAAFATAVGITAGCLVLATLRYARRPALIVGAAALAGAVALAWPSATASQPEQRHGFTARDVALDGGSLPGPWFGRIPEIELVRAAASLGLAPAERRAWQAVGGRLLAQLSAVDTPQRVLDSWLADRRDYRLLVPDGAGPFPLLVFLHGNGGLSEAYTAMLHRLCTDERIAIALPRFGFGHWTGPDAHARIEAVRADALKSDRVERPAVLAGLSAGGMGVVRHLIRAPDSFDAFVAVSGVPLEELAVPAPLAARIALVHGEKDQRIPVARVKQVAADLEARGAGIGLELLPAGHLALLTHPEEVLAALRGAFH